MTTVTSRDLLSSSDKHHLMLLYDNEADRSSAEIDCINQALSSGQYCVYATVDADDEDFARGLAIRINEYHKHVREGNFLLVNFKPFYHTAANGQLTLFNQLKADVEKTLKSRIASGKSGKALLVADAACNLSRHKQFDECVTLESWWQDTYNDWISKNLDITIICAHPASVLKQQSLLDEQSRISRVHSLTLDLNDFKAKAAPDAPSVRPLRILVAEPDLDIRTIYQYYLKSLPVELSAVDSANECSRLVERGLRYDLVVIDTHMKDMDGLELAKKILDQNKNQNIVITSTWDAETVISSLKLHAIDTQRCQILHKPFRFSQLLGLIRPMKEAKQTVS